MKAFKNILLKILSYLIILILILIIAFSFLSKGDTKAIMGYRFLTVLTGSMEPELNVGSLILVKEIPLNDLKVEDIITYKTQNNGSLVTHRIVKINDNGSLISKGDANNTEDIGEIKESQIQGKVIFSISKMGEVLLYLKQNIIIVIAILIIILFAPEIIRKIKCRIPSSDKKSNN